jgi:hypothetical protein
MTLELTLETSITDGRKYYNSAWGKQATPPGPWEIKLISLTGKSRNGLTGMKPPHMPQTTRGQREMEAKEKVEALTNADTLPDGEILEAYINPNADD